MKYLYVLLFIAILFLIGIGSAAPMKKLKCAGNTCYVLEKTYWNKKPKIKQRFYKSQIRYVDIETQEGVDYLVLKTYTGDIYLKFVHTTKTMFKSKSKLKADLNLFFANLVNSDKNVETEWQRDLGSIQIYMFGKPLFQ